MAAEIEEIIGRDNFLYPEDIRSDSAKRPFFRCTRAWSDIGAEYMLRFCRQGREVNLAIGRQRHFPYDTP